MNMVYIYNYNCHCRVPLKHRLQGSLLIITLSFLVTTAFVQVDTDDWQNAFFIITLITVVIMTGKFFLYYILIFINDSYHKQNLVHIYLLLGTLGPVWFRKWEWLFYFLITILFVIWKMFTHILLFNNYIYYYNKNIIE